DTIIASLPGEFLTSSFYPTVADSDALILNTVLTNSPLLMYNSDFERIPVLAESWESSDDGLSYTFHLRDATFHNGDPVTPEDVKWTYEFLNEKYHEGTYAHTRMPESMTVEVVDDSTVRFNTDEPQPTLITSQLPAFGVLPRDPYLDAGIEDNPVDFDDPMIGAGPFSIESYRNQESIELEPHDGHPVWEPSDSIIALTFDSVDSTVRALQEGEINLGTALTPEAGQRLEESMDNVQVISGVAHVCYGLFPQMSFGPCKFHEFREALGYMLDREAINETYALGTSEPITHATFQSKYHPWTNLDVLTECGTAGRDVEQARTLLEEAGWGWDDNGNLHYPPGAELEAWPQGEGPSPEEYPCLEG
ncbi:MAG: ABC transporter substrate-binding protein, partial [Halobacteriales archaeon]|nr:ABC transporter substrate-binding protein [Halobacteriales archaeon]